MPRILALSIGLLWAFAAHLTPAHATDDVLRETLPNGLRVIVVRDALTPMIAMRLVYLAGSIDASAEFPGTAHALEHMMFRGTPNLSSDQFGTAMQAAGGIANAMTSFDRTQYIFNIAPADLRVFLHIEADRMQNLSLDADQWARERGAIEQEVSQDRSVPVVRAREQFRAMLLSGTPYAWDALGTRQSFDTTDVARLSKFYRTWYAPNNAVLLIVGDVVPVDAMATVHTAFDGVPQRDVPSHAAIQPPPETLAPQTLTAPTDMAFGMATIGWRMPDIHNSDYAALQIMAAAINSPRGPLGTLSIAGKSLGAGYSYEGYHHAGIAVATVAFPRDATADSYLARLKTVLADFQTNGIPADLVEAAKRRQIKETELERNSIVGLTGAWLHAAVDLDLPDPDSLTRQYAAVTPAQVNALAHRYLSLDHAITQVWQPNGKIAPTHDTGFGGAEKFGSKDAPQTPLPDWAHSLLSIPPTPRLTHPAADWKLPNGIRLIVRPMHDTHTVVLRGAIRQNENLETPTGKEGVAGLTGALLLFGTEARDRIATAKAADDIGSKISLGTNFGLAASSEDFAASIALLADTELHPAFRQTDLANVQDRLVHIRQGVMLTPNHAFLRAVLADTLPQGDPELRESTPQTLQGLTRDDVVAYFQHAYRPDMTVIEVIGDIEPQAARRAVMAAFGNWHASGPKPNVVAPEVPDLPPTTLQMSAAGRTQDEVFLQEPVRLRDGKPEDITFGLGNAVLSAGFSSRLTQALRTSTGYVYTVRSLTAFDKTRGHFLLAFGADPDKVSRAKARALSILEDMRANPVGDDELMRVKAAYLRTVPFESASLDSIATHDLRCATKDLPLDQTARDIRMAQTTTPKMIRDVFSQEIHPEKLSLFIFGPSPSAVAMH